MSQNYQEQNKMSDQIVIEVNVYLLGAETLKIKFLVPLYTAVSC